MEAAIQRLDEVVNLCKDHAKTVGNCNVFWATEQILGKDYPKGYFQKVANRVQEDRRFRIAPSLEKEGTFDVFMNSYFEVEELQIRMAESTIDSNRNNKIFGIVNLVFAIINLLGFIISIIR